MNTLKIEIGDGLGEVEVTTAALDWAMDHYLPTNILRLRTTVESEVEEMQYVGISSAVECLAILADLHCNTPNHPYRVQ